MTRRQPTGQDIQRLRDVLESAPVDEVRNALNDYRNTYYGPRTNFTNLHVLCFAAQEVAGRTDWVTPLFESQAHNPHIDVIEYAIQQGLIYGRKHGDDFIIAVYANNPNPDVIDMMVDQYGFNILHDFPLRGTALHIACSHQRSPAVVKRIFDRVVEKSGRNPVDILESTNESTTIHTEGALYLIAVYNFTPEVLIQVLDLYPEPMRLQKYTEARDYILRETAPQWRQQHADHLRALNDGIQRNGGDTQTTPTMLTQNNEGTRWWVFLVILILIVCLSLGALYVLSLL